MSRSSPSSRPRVRIISAIVILGLYLVAGPARAAPTDPAEVVREFYDTLQSAMRNGLALGSTGRFCKLDPVVRKTFDIAFMTRLAVGPSWASIPAEQQRQLMDAFERYVAAIYADRFDSYSGERLEVVGQRALSNDIVVQTRIVKSTGEPVGIN
jgi:phospholipid transport system substrate-binding protein